LKRGIRLEEDCMFCVQSSDHREPLGFVSLVKDLQQIALKDRALFLTHL
jgi:biotin synthase-like enzyme